MTRAAALLAWLAHGAQGRAPVRTLVLGAHPDDETVGAGGHLAALDPAAVVCATDGAPRRLPEAPALAARRANELVAALAAADLGANRLRLLGAPDQEAIFAVGALALALRNLFAELRPDVVLTHAYEGGHPDHDATALAAHLACRACHEPPDIAEFALYNVEGPVRFLPGGTSAIECRLDPERRARKARMVACHASQASVLAGFPMDVERFRAAPRHDFVAPPHPGPLHYERYDWGMDGARWRALARAALAEAEGPCG